jgi:hypothetical protein
MCLCVCVCVCVCSVQTYLLIENNLKSTVCYALATQNEQIEANSSSSVFLTKISLSPLCLPRLGFHFAKSLSKTSSLLNLILLLFTLLVYFCILKQISENQFSQLTFHLMNSKFYRF